MLKFLLIALAVVGAVAVVGIAWAKHQGYCAGGDYLQHVTERVSRKLDLDDEQTAKLHALAETLRGLRSEWDERRTPMRETLGSLLAGPLLDRDRVMELLDERHQTMAERNGEVVGAFADFSDSLHPEQRTRLAKLIGERMEHPWGHPRWAH